jgi:hypothetical protein
MGSAHRHSVFLIFGKLFNVQPNHDGLDWVSTLAPISLIALHPKQRVTI